MQEHPDGGRRANAPAGTDRSDALSLIIRNVAFTLLVPGTVAIYVPLFLFERTAPGTLVATVPGVLSLLLGGSIFGWCIWDFAAYGRGTPAPIDPPQRLVRRGLYRYTRNPMYLGVLLVILGWAILFASVALAIYALGVALAFHLFVRLYEEPHLRAVFGTAYERYCAEVGRWLPWGPVRARRSRHNRGAG